MFVIMMMIDRKSWMVVDEVDEIISSVLPLKRTAQEMTSATHKTILEQVRARGSSANVKVLVRVLSLFDAASHLF